MESDSDNTSRLTIIQLGTKGASFCYMFYCDTYGMCVNWLGFH
jgi:hypothetical protein